MTNWAVAGSIHWLKIENPVAPAVRRLEEEDWADDGAPFPAPWTGDDTGAC